MVFALAGSALVAVAQHSAVPHESSDAQDLKTLLWPGIGAAPAAGAHGGSGSESSPAGAAAMQQCRSELRTEVLRLLLGSCR